MIGNKERKYLAALIIGLCIGISIILGINESIQDKNKINVNSNASTIFGIFESNNGVKSNSAVFDNTVSLDKGNRSVDNRDVIWQWAQQAGGLYYEYGDGVAVDMDGNTYITGRFGGNTTIGYTNLTCQGSFDIFVAKLDTDGIWQWAQSIGGAGDDIIGSISVDTDGNVYITGSFNGSVGFGITNLTSQGYYDVFVAKLNTNGGWLWVQSAGGTFDAILDLLKRYFSYEKSKQLYHSKISKE